MKNRRIIIISIITILLGVIALFYVLSSKDELVMASLPNEILNEGNLLTNNNLETNDIVDKNEIIDSSELKGTIENEVVTKPKPENTSENKVSKQPNKGNTTGNSNSTTQPNTGTTPYYIKVNYGAQVVNVYKKDKDGNYTIPLKAMTCSTGTATPKSGVYKIPGRWNWGALEGGVYGQYITVITGQILFHSVPYIERYNPGSLEYAEYDKLGTKASAGCVRLTVKDALWIHQNCKNGTQVEFYSSTNPGPLGKPDVKKISNASPELKNWDPTDPDSSNPWKYPPKEDSSPVESNNIDNKINNAID